jgi:hypothetical protein
LLAKSENVEYSLKNKRKGDFSGFALKVREEFRASKIHRGSVTK